MVDRDRRRGFARAGSFPGRQLPFAARRRRELELALAWRSVAGRAIADRTTRLALRSGTLILETEERRWAETLRGLLPELGRRLARLRPGLGVRRCRVVLLGDAGPSVTVPLAPEEEGHDPEARPRREPIAERSPSSPEEMRRRLEELGPRLIARRAPGQKP